MKKNVIALRGVGNSGKTTSLKLLRNMLCKKNNTSESYYRELENPEKDFISFIRIGETTICITSQGDYAPLMRKPLESAISKNCNIIICACRSYGDTQSIINDIFIKYKKTWITKNQLHSDTDDQESFRAMANKNSAELILYIVEKIKL